MTTTELLAIIDNAKTRAEVVPALADTLPPSGNGIDYKAIYAAVAAKWSRATWVWILTQAWKIAESRQAQP